MAVLELGQCQQAFVRRFCHEPRELRHAEILLVERAVHLLHHLLQSIGTHDVVVALHPLDRFGDELPRILFDNFLFAGLHQPRERVVTVVLVAVHDEQVAG